MKWHRFFLTVAAILLSCAQRGAVRAQEAAAHVYSDAGDIYIERGGTKNGIKNGAKTKLTSSEMDIDPVLAPNGAYVVYTRQGRGRTVHGYDTSQVCSTEPRPDELRQINADGSGDKLLLRAAKAAPKTQLCDFRQKQFSSDGRRLYFLTPGWATSGALHVFDTAQRRRPFRHAGQRRLWCSASARTNTRTISSCWRTALSCSAAATTGTGSTMQRAKKSWDRSASSARQTTWCGRRTACGAPKNRDCLKNVPQTAPPARYR